MTYTDFLRLFPDNNACMDYLRDRFYPAGAACPNCGKATKFHRVRGRSAYACQYCRHQVYPTAGTVFHKSTTSLQLWFWAIFLMSSTRCGISAKQLEREIGVTYKTAHRMFKQIRTLLAEDDDEPLDGEVEVDETLWGGKPRAGDTAKYMVPSDWNRHKAAHRWIAANKSTVFGMVERGGRVHVEIVPDRQGPTLKGRVVERVLPSAMIFTDEYRAYRGLRDHFAGHQRIMHKQKIYVHGNVHTQTIEGFFGLLKNGIRGVYHAVSTTYLQSYLDEYAWRYNHRHDDQPMFWSILEGVRKAPSPAA
jgi:transposase